MIQSKLAAVIDLGTNSIKFIIAEKMPPNTLRTHYEETVEIRIGAGISRSQPSLEDSAMEEVCEAIISLLRIKDYHKVDLIRIVATSAVREANNSKRLIDLIKTKTGIQLEVLNGEKEAFYIAQAIQLNPDYRTIGTLNSIDLGGGSLEWISLKNNRLEKALSLPLGAVRITEQFITDPNKAIPQDTIRLIEEHVISIINQNEMLLSPKCPLLGSGGAFYILKQLLNQASSFTQEDIRRLSLASACLSPIERIDNLKIPEKRADIIPAAFITVACIMNHFAIKNIEHSKSSLKFGILKEMLGI
jgi:exopolyphosphatase/guanosine-5'-triphosphate,3'-diphosphate pyrophosphatase